MKSLIRAGAKDFYVRQKAIDILLEKGVSPKHYLGEIKALFEWVQRNVRYTKDPFRVEVLHSARRMLELRAGDCDDMSILLGSMLEAIGHPVRLVLVGPDPLQPRLFSHVYPEVYHKGRWIPLDATMSHPMGWAPQGLVRTRIVIDRRQEMLSQNIEVQGIGAAATPDWLRGLLRGVWREGLQPKDARVKTLWDLLRKRGLLARNPWLRARLGYIWGKGLTARERPRTTRHMLRLLRAWGIIPPRFTSSATRRPIPIRPLRPVSVRPVASAAARR